MKTAEINHLGFFLLLAVTYQCERTLNRNSYETWQLVRDYYTKENFSHIEQCLLILEPHISYDKNSDRLDPYQSIQSPFMLRTKSTIRLKKKQGLQIEKTILNEIHHCLIEYKDMLSQEIIEDDKKFSKEKHNLAEYFNFFSGYLGRSCPHKLLACSYHIECNNSHTEDNLSVSDFMILVGYFLGCLVEFSCYTRQARQTT
jgi:hypothetical protein